MTLYEEYDARYEAWQREQTLASLDDCGIILPMDGSWQAYRRDYPKFDEERFHRFLNGICAVGIIVVCSALIYVEYFA